MEDNPSSDSLIFLLSTDWFASVWERHWLLQGAKSEDFDSIARNAKSATRQVMATANSYWNTEFTDRRRKRTLSAVIQLSDNPDPRPSTVAIQFSNFLDASQSYIDTAWAIGSALSADIISEEFAPLALDIDGWRKLEPFVKNILSAEQASELRTSEWDEKLEQWLGGTGEFTFSFYAATVYGYDVAGAAYEAWLGSTSSMHRNDFWDLLSGLISKLGLMDPEPRRVEEVCKWIYQSKNAH